MLCLFQPRGMLDLGLHTPTGWFLLRLGLILTAATSAVSIRPTMEKTPVRMEEKGQFLNYL